MMRDIGRCVCGATVFLMGIAGVSRADVVAPVSATATSSFFTEPENLISGLGLIDNGGAVETQLHNNVETDGWLANGDAQDQVLEFTLGGNYNLTNAHIWQHNGLDGGGMANLGRGMNGFEILVSADLEAPFVSVGNFTLNQATNPFLNSPSGEAAQSFTLSGAAVANVRRVRFDVIDAHGGTFEANMGLAEVRFEGDVLPPVAERLWSLDGTGSWHVGTNWNPIEFPAGNDQDALFGSAITAPTTIAVDQVATVRNIQFDNANKYAIAGTSQINLTSNSGTSAITVLQGTHELQADVHLQNDATVTTSGAGHGLEINNALVLNGNTLTVAAGSNVAINNTIDDSSGGMVINSGVLQGSGRVNGSLVNLAGGEVAPGDGLGAMIVDDDFTLSANSSLEIQLGSAGHDSLSVGGTAIVDGTLSLNLLGGFTPTPGAQFEVLTATGGITNNGLTLGGPGAAGFTMIVGTNNILLQASGGALNCDFDGDGSCDIADMNLLYMNFGGGTLYDVDQSGTVDEGDIAAWLNGASSPANPYLGGTKTFQLGDVDLDGKVDSTDLGRLLNNFNDTNAVLFGGGDMNNDSIVNSADLGVLLNNFGNTSASAAAVPEPTSKGLIGFALISLATQLSSRRKNRRQ